MSIEIFIDLKHLDKGWNIGNPGFNVLEPLLQERFQNDSEGWEAIESGVGVGAIALPAISEGWSPDVARRVAEGLVDVANEIASGRVDLYEYESAEQEQKTRDKFAQLVVLLEEFLEKG